MFIYNVKFNGKSIIKIVFIIIAIFITIFFSVSAYKIFKQSFIVSDEYPPQDITYIESNNYTNILKSVHDNPEKYIGKKICFTGYIYRLIDFTDTQFVLARDMLVDSNTKTLVVGFLCELKNAQDFKDDSWIELTGEINEGDYHGSIPVLKVTKINQISKPDANLYVYPPDNTYIPTSSLSSI